MLYHKPSAMPFSKPRFILRGSHELFLVNLPTVPPDQIVDVLMNFEEWGHQRYEFYYQPQDYTDAFWFKSRLMGAAIGGIDHLWDFWNPSGERRWMGNLGS